MGTNKRVLNYQRFQEMNILIENEYYEINVIHTLDSSENIL
jgi:hypothetical protein